MSMHRCLAAALWLLAAAAAFAIGASWAGDAQSGKMTPWALVALFWGAALVAVLVHYLALGGDALTRYLHHHKRLSGPRPGAELPE